MGFILWLLAWSNTGKSINITDYINRTKEKKTHDHLNGCRKYMRQLSMPIPDFFKEPFSKVEMERNFFKIIKYIYDKTKSNLKLNAETVNVFH